MSTIVKKTRLISLFTSIAFVLTACYLPARPGQPTQAIDLNLVGTIAAMTLQAIPLQTSIPSATQAVVQPSATQILTKTTTTTITPTFSAPMVLFEGNTNCRKGPGTGYEVVTVLLNGQKTEAIGVSESGNYWFVKNPNKGQDCWVANDLVKPSGSILQLPTMKAPPTPSPVPPNAPAWSSYNYTCDFASGGSNMTMNLVWSDRSENEQGYIVYRDGQAIVTLAANTTTYVDTSFVGAGQTLSYFVEVFNNAGRARSTTITYGCQ